MKPRFPDSMTTLRLSVAVAILVGCGDPNPESVSSVPGSSSPGQRSTASLVAAKRGDARLVFIPQAEASDCGPAAMATVLTYYGRPTTLDASKAATHYHAEGTSALDLVNAAEANGLGAVGVSADADSALPFLRTGDILHFDSNHFLVFDAVAEDGVHLMDPAVGHRVIDRAAFAKQYSGVALLFARSPAELDVRKRSLPLTHAQ